MRKSIAPEDVQHGTYSGWNWHNNHKVPMCDPCRRARTDYTAQRRRVDPEVMKRHKAMQAATLRAKSRLMKAHSDEYRDYYRQELATIYEEWAHE